LGNGIDVIAFEQTKGVGGTWVYNEAVGKDENGNDIHSSMYKSLLTNLPKELMCFPDLAFPEQESSYIPAADVESYLNLYADTFNLRDRIKFEHLVMRVRPLRDQDKWEVIVKNLKTVEYEEAQTFDAVLVCNGHFSEPSVPQLPGQRLYEGRQLHSHDYRTPDTFRGEQVLVVGAGPSGMDITQEIAQHASHVYWSTHLKAPKQVAAPNVIHKPDVQELSRTGAVFVDGSAVELTSVVYATGYEFVFPFLSVDSNVSCYENYVQPLWKHCMSINRPSLAIIGLPFQVCPFQLFDLQVKFCLRFMSGQRKLPTRDEMLADTAKDMQERWSRGLATRKAHIFGQGIQDVYYDDLATTADIEPIKRVILGMYAESRRTREANLSNYRRIKFRILDDERFATASLP